MKGFGNWLIVAVIGFSILSSGQAWGQNRRPSTYNRQRTQAAISQTQAQLVGAQQVLKVAMTELAACQAAVAGLQGKLESATEASKTSRTEVGTNAQHLRELEQQIENSQPKDSPFATAKAAFVEAKEALERDQARVFQSAEYKSKFQEISQGSEKSEKLPKLKEETLKNDLAFQRTRIQFDAARAAYDKERSALLAKNAEWLAANKDAAATRSEQTKAEQMAQAHAMQKMTANSKLKEATQVAATAQANVQQLTATLHSLQRSIGQKPTTPGESKATQPKPKK